MLFQELFYGPYFCQVQDPQYYSYTELIPDGPTTKRMQDLAKQTGMVLVVPMYEEDEQASGIYYNTAAVIDADGKYLGKYRKTHIPHVKGFWEKFYFRPGQPGLPGVRDRGRQGRRLHLLRPPLPGGRPGARPERRRDGVHPERDVTRPVASTCGGSSRSATRSPTATSSARSTGSASRPTIGDDDFYGQSYFVDPRGQFIGDLGSAHDEELMVRDMDLDMITEVRQTWQFYRDRRPDAYEDLVALGAIIADGSAVWRRTAEPHRLPGRQPRCSSASRSSPTTRIERTIALTRQAEAAGFDYGWLFDSHVLWREPYPLLTLMAQATERMRLGTCVTNPATREPSVTASALATLDELSGGRMDLGIGRGDSARRVLGKPPTTMATLEEAITRHPGARRRARRSRTRAPTSTSRGRAAGTSRSGSPATARWPWR